MRGGRTGLGGAAALAAALVAASAVGAAHALPAQPQGSAPGSAQADASPPAAPVRKPRELKSIAIHYLERRIDRPAPRNNEDPTPADQGLKGAELGVSDSNATGRFVGLRFEVRPTVVEPDADIVAAFAELAAREAPRFLVVNAPAADLLAIADSPAARDLVIFNVSATDTRLRDADCRARVLHVIPSRDMLSDALMQFLTFKRWMRILLVAGPGEGDRLYAEAVRRSARKFGLRIVDEKTFDARGADIRDSATDELTLATRGAEHDVVAVADEADEFGDALPYNTASPRPVVGTHGMTPAAWGKPVEAWAAVQLQDRFKKLAGRQMDAVDYSGWMAAHAVGQAATQLKSADPEAISGLLLGDAFEVGGFKGRALSFRAWNGQLRQPIYLLWPGAVVATAPLEGFLHRRTEMDTLGLDQPESACKAMKG